MDNKVILIAYINILHGFEKQVKKAMITMAAESCKETGCEQYLINTRNDSPQTIVTYEVYQNDEAFQVHKTSAYAKTFFEYLKGKIKNDKVEVVFLTELNS
jgi:quinol monooxygenase YgiN